MNTTGLNLRPPVLAFIPIKTDEGNGTFVTLSRPPTGLCNTAAWLSHAQPDLILLTAASCYLPSRSLLHFDGSWLTSEQL